MNRIELSDALQQPWDVVIAGSSFAACFFAHGLRGRNLRILMLERGPMIERETQLETRHSEIPPQVKLDNRSGQRKDWAVRYQFGGCSNCWWGNTPRFHPSDLQLQSRYGRGQDWPISYAELEPFLVQVEDFMEVAGNPDSLGFARPSAYPFPAHGPTNAEIRLMEHSPTWQPMPTSRSNGGNRPGCCVSGTCNLCPIDAKFTILNSMELFDDAGLFFATDAEVRRVTTTAGAARGVTLRRPDGQEAEITADFVALAANPISNAAILLRSGLGSDLVGRGLHEQLGQFAWVDTEFDNYFGGTSLTGVGYALYDGAFRRDAASVLIESWNAPPSLRLERGKWLKRLKLKFIAEDLPQPENRVVLEDDEAKIVWVGHSDYAYAGLERARNALPELLPFPYELQRFGGFEPTEAHIIGGTPMAADPETGVVDRNSHVFGVEGLACLGAGTFPTGAAANPTLTLSALSLRAGGLL